MLKKLNLILFAGVFVLGFNVAGYAEDDFLDDYEDVEFEGDDFIEEDLPVAVDKQSLNQDETELAEQVSVQALQDYDASGSLFEKITMLEQEKVVMQLEKERAQLDLELDRLNAERIKLQMELDTLSGRADKQQYELDAAKTQLEIQAEKLKQQKNAIDYYESEPERQIVEPQPKKEMGSVSKKYRLINVIGVDNQLQATVEDLSTGQNKRIAVGKDLDGYIVKAISLNDGIVFEKDGIDESLNIGK